MNVFFQLEGESLGHDQRAITAVDKREEKMMKGTSALQLVWTTPDSSEETHVPPSAFSHLESQVGQ